MKRISILLMSAALLTFWCSALSAQVLPQEMTVEKLDNGLTVITVPWDTSGMTAMYTLVRTGSRDETDKGHTGFAHLFEHMMFRGTEKVPKDLYERKIQEYGADNNAFTGSDPTVYTLTVPTEVLPETIEIEADRFRNLKYTEADFKTETGAVLGEYYMNAASPRVLMREKLLETAFKKHTYGHTVIGYFNDVKAMPKYFNYSKKFHKWFYTPDNIFIVLVGDFDRASVMEKVKAEYGSWKGKRKKTRVKKEPEQKKPRSVHVPWSGSTSPQMIIAYKTPAFETTRDSAALEVLSHLVFGETSPLYRQLVLDEQKVLSLYASAARSRDPYLFQISAKLKDGTTFDEIQASVDQAIAQVAAGNIANQRIEDVKSHVSYRFRLGLETAKNVAVSVAMFTSATGDPEGINKYGKVLSEITPEDVKRAAQQYLTTSRRTVVTMASEKGGN